MSARLSAVLALVVIGFARQARAEPRPLTIQYRAHEGCPTEDVLLEEITWRTPLARAAKPGEEGLEVRARIDKRGATSRGHVSVWTGRAWITREISGQSCDEVVSALGLVTALAIDPHATTGRKAPSPPPLPPPAPKKPFVLPPEPPRPAWPERAPDLAPPPLPAFPVAWDRKRPWVFGARATIAIGPAPRPLFGGAMFVRRVLDADLGASLTLSAALASTGTFDIGPSGASFLQAGGRIDGCVFAIRPVKWLSIVPCAGAEGGVIRGVGETNGVITSSQAATVPWLSLGFLPLVAIDLGPLVIEAQGGPAFPLVRREFLFENPDFVVHHVPPVTGILSLGAAVHFP